MGMAFESLSIYGVNTTFQKLISEGKLDSPVFGIKFSTSGSELFLGGLNTALYCGEITWIPLTVVVSQIFNRSKCVSDASCALIGFLASVLRYDH